ncbi:MAG: 3-oxoacyl-[acyl-carrier-protein] reductase [Firmicutes bacterium]|nr:3-oxoacyl-[acyl-carrier-protein] reductase [Bacillota bacterium]
MAERGGVVFRDKVVVVTGGSRGIGRAIALRFGELGAKVAVNYLKSADAAQEVVEKIKAAGGDGIAIQADVSDYESAGSLIDRVLETWGQVDCLVNNAGITQDTLLLRMNEESWDKVINTNLKSVYNCTKHVCRPMFRRRSGVIINVASVVGLIGNAGQANYAAAKAGIIAFTKSVAREAAPRQVRVNAVAPGFIESDMTAKLSEKVVEEYKSNIPLNRLGKPEDVAAAVTFLASDEASYITGQTLVVDGGLVMY